MFRRPPRPTRTDPRFPCTTLCRTATAATGRPAVPARTHRAEATAAWCGRHHRAVELSAVSGRWPAGRRAGRGQPRDAEDERIHAALLGAVRRAEIGRASCRERVYQYV